VARTDNKAKAKRENAEIYWGDQTGMRNDSQHEHGYGPKVKTPVVRLNANRSPNSAETCWRYWKTGTIPAQPSSPVNYRWNNGITLSVIQLLRMPFWTASYITPTKSF
jgi:hypothetical protein